MTQTPAMKANGPLPPIAPVPKSIFLVFVTNQPTRVIPQVQQNANRVSKSVAPKDYRNRRAEGFGVRRHDAALIWRRKTREERPVIAGATQSAVMPAHSERLRLPTSFLAPYLCTTVLSDICSAPGVTQLFRHWPELKPFCCCFVAWYIAPAPLMQAPTKAAPSWRGSRIRRGCKSFPRRSRRSTR